MQLKKKWRGYFTFSRRERNVGMYLLMLIILITVAPAILGFVQPKQSPVSQEIIAGLQFNFEETKAIIAGQKKEYQDFNYQAQDDIPDNEKENTITQNSILFPFNPNNVTQQQWIILGVAPEVANRLVNYIAKGGKFTSKTDLLKTYGFTQSDLDRLDGYIQFDSVDAASATHPENIAININRVETNINTATKEDLMALGFTADNAARVIKFREGAGGIYDVGQLYTVYGIDIAMLDEIQPYLFISGNDIIKININTADAELMAKHVYISDELAQAIYDYRMLTGKFYSINELRKVPGMYAALFEKLKPYFIL